MTHLYDVVVTFRKTGYFLPENVLQAYYNISNMTEFLRERQQDVQNLDMLIELGNVCKSIVNYYHVNYVNASKMNHLIRLLHKFGWMKRLVEERWQAIQKATARALQQSEHAMQQAYAHALQARAQAMHQGQAQAMQQTCAYAMQQDSE